eukprot:6210818-Pleurochrysis_carterae.AAC.5
MVGIVERLHADVEQLLVLVGREVAKGEGGDNGAHEPLAAHLDRQLLVLERHVDVVDDERRRVVHDGHVALALLVHDAAELAARVVFNVEHLAREGANGPVGGRHFGAVDDALRPVEVGLLELDVEGDVLGGEHGKGDVARTAEVGTAAVRQAGVPPPAEGTAMAKAKAEVAVAKAEGAVAKVEAAMAVTKAEVEMAMGATAGGKAVERKIHRRSATRKERQTS